MVSGNNQVKFNSSVSGGTINGTYSISSGFCAGDSGTFSLARGTPPLKLGNAIQYTTNGFPLGKTAIGDLNGDGLNDVVTMESGFVEHYILIYYQNTSNNLDDPVVLELLDTNTRSFALGDVNGDDKTDLVVSGMATEWQVGYPGRLVIYYQNISTGELNFGLEITVSTGLVGDVTIADLNSDGREDIAVLAEWTTTPGMGNVALFYQNSDGTLAAESLYDATPVVFTGELHAADMDSDGDIDLVLPTGLLQFAVIKQDSTQTPAVLLSTPDYYSVQTSYWGSFDAFAVGDLDGDGSSDVAVLDPGNNGYLNLFYQNDTGTLDGPFLTTIQPTPFGIEIADIDNDGENEILGDASGYVFVFEREGSPPFSSYTTYTFPTISFGGSTVHQALSVGDVTGDGYADAVVTWGGEGLYVLPAVLNCTP